MPMNFTSSGLGPDENIKWTGTNRYESDLFVESPATINFNQLSIGYDNNQDEHKINLTAFGTPDDLSIEFTGDPAFKITDGAAGDTKVQMEGDIDVQDNYIFTSHTEGGAAVTILDNIKSESHINMSNSSPIKDSGTDVIEFDGSANVTISNGNLSLGDTNQLLNIDSIDGIQRRSSDITPANGEGALWISDGTGSGSDGDLMYAETTSGGTTSTYIIDKTSV